MTMLFVQKLTLWFCAGLCIWAAVSDLRAYLIPNRICLAIVALYLPYLLAGYLGGMPVDWSGGVIAAALIFATGFVLFNFGLVGGGDVKLFAAVGLWTGLNWLLPLVLVIALAGGILSIGMVMAKAASLMRLPADVRAVVYPDGRMAMLRAAVQMKAPYGAAIAVGGLFIVYRLLGVTLL